MSENNSNNKPSFFKAFFVSLGQDIKHLITKRWMKAIGLFVMYVLPLIVLLVGYGVEGFGDTKTKTFTIIGWVIIVIFILIYWSAFRRYLTSKLAVMKERNLNHAGKHIATILIAQVLQILMSILPFILVVWVGGEIIKMLEAVKQMVLFVGVCMGLGGMFLIGDTILNLNRS